MNKISQRILLVVFLVALHLVAPVRGDTRPSAMVLAELTNEQSVGFQLEINEIAWFQFDAEALIDQNSYLDITTSFGQLNDTEMALYDAAGYLVASDDDDGVELRSTLSFGTGSGLELGDPFNLGNDGDQNDGDGRALGDDGELPSGTYYLAVGAYESRFGESDFDAHSFSDLSGNSQITFYTTSVPEPCGIGFAALLAWVGIGRKFAAI